MHHFGDEQPFQDLGGRARQLALARAGLATYQQRPLCRQRGTYRPGRIFVETVYRRRPRTALWQRDLVEEDAGNDRGVHGFLASCSGMVRKFRITVLK
ncbi:MAG: hypothetical protein AW09_000394 [Candidatus Accumulibacter phosphatis]|uniref:Uncharacterized protein n=1 Tax=Candidatus Accumulibacter phosphatis TaxID=327160 RepID=A0A080LZC2_9PROT|nr:MAG: hypothetical protein AW09_000394 [Candidatus Accumulibacter phosphatis]